MEIKHVVSRLGRPLARRLTAHAPRILMYHRFSAGPAWRRITRELFEAQLKYLRRHFSIIRLSELARAISAGRAPGRNTVAITVDDGYLDFLEIAVPLLEKYRVPATLFIISDFAGQKMWLWYDAIHYLVQHANAGIDRIDTGNGSIPLDLHTPATRNASWSRLADHVLYAPDSVKQEFVEHCARQLGVELPSTPADEYRSMDWDELSALGPLIDLGSHTCTHPILSTISDPAVLEREIGGSGRIIAGKTGKRVETFCYPNGLAPDYNAQTVECVRNAGYLCAVLASGGLVSPPLSPYELPRITAVNHIDEFRNIACGVEALRMKYSATGA